MYIRYEMVWASVCWMLQTLWCRFNRSIRLGHLRVIAVVPVGAGTLGFQKKIKRGKPKKEANSSEMLGIKVKKKTINCNDERSEHLGNCSPRSYSPTCHEGTCCPQGFPTPKIWALSPPGQPSWQAIMSLAVLQSWVFGWFSWALDTQMVCLVEHCALLWWFEG